MTLRERAAGGLPEGAFLRRDRGRALYITNAPAIGEIGDMPGLRAEVCGGLAHIYVEPGALEDIAGEMGFSEDRLARELAGFRGGSEGAAELFAEAAKALEAPAGADADGLDRRIRQAAAVALREGGGEGLYFCALALAELKRRQAEV